MTMAHINFRKIRRLALKSGWRIRLCGSGHEQWIPPDKSKPIVTISSTPSNPGALNEIIQWLKRSGLEVRVLRTQRVTSAC